MPKRPKFPLEKRKYTIRRNTTKKSISWFEDHLDTKWKTYGKEDAYCEICATLPEEERINYTQLQAHHIIGRQSKASRWLLVNRIWLCARHHTLGGQVGNKQIPVVQDNIGGWFLNWESDNDWMGIHKPEQKEQLREFWGMTKKWSLDELEDFYNNFELRSMLSSLGDK